MGGYWYKQTEPHLWTVGQDFSGEWQPESDHGSKEEAAARVRYLNGGTVREMQTTMGHGLRAGMMWAEDFVTPPRGRVIIHADERFVHMVLYEIPGNLTITGLFVRTVGVDTLPGFTNWCDAEMASHVQQYLMNNDLWEPEQWGEWYRREQFGPSYLERRFGNQQRTSRRETR